MIPAAARFVVTCYPQHIPENKATATFKFLEGYRFGLRPVEVGLLQPVTSPCRHVRYVLIEFKDLDVFQ